MKSYEKKFLTVMILVLSFFVSMTLLSIKNAEGKTMEECNRKCLDLIDMNQCIDEELKYWENIEMREAVKSCKFLIREEYRMCKEECKEEN